jgi:hypothetical protein
MYSLVGYAPTRTTPSKFMVTSTMRSEREKNLTIVKFTLPVSATHPIINHNPAKVYGVNTSLGSTGGTDWPAVSVVPTTFTTKCVGGVED